MKDLIILYAVNYCELETLKDKESIRTHSKEKAERFAKYLKNCDNVLYSQIATYVYDTHADYYRFKTLNNYYKD